jgi:hypothetical protein
MGKKTLGYHYYHERIIKTYQFLIPSNKKILFYGSLDGKGLKKLSPRVGVGIEPNEELCQLAQKRFPQLKFINRRFENYKPEGKFDYVVLNGALDKTSDMLMLLKNIQMACKLSTRIIVYQHNYLWQWILFLAEKLNLKRLEGNHNWLSISDVRTYLEGVGFQNTRVFRRTIFPLDIFGLGKIINYMVAIFPFFDFFKLDQFIIARPEATLFSNKFTDSLTVCLTVRNEKGNIEKIVKTIPRICRKQEILFIEGHSTDGTREEIERVRRLYKSKNIRVIGQPGKGQGDAIRVGFKDAKGEIIVLYEGDGTSDPRDIYYFYEAMKSGRFEFIEGSRFVYPLSLASMPLLNQVGNTLFAKWFSFFLGQKTTDVLSGIKAIYKRDYNLLFEEWGFLGFNDPFGDFELLYGAARMGLKIGEIPMRYYPRTYGQSKTQHFTQGLYLLKMAAKGYLMFRNN